MIETIRAECLDWTLILGRDHLDRTLRDSLTYAWALTAKPAASAATIANPTSANPTFTPDVAGSYTFCLTVTDSHGLSSVPVCASLTASGIPVP